jgi:MFS family permease
VWGVLSDFIGRKITLLIVNIWILVFGILSAIKVAADDPAGKMVGYPWLLICRFGVGFGAGGTAQAVTYFSEFLPRKARGYCLVLIEFWWAIGSMFGALLALGVMNSIGWHWYLGIATFPLFFVLFLFPVVYLKKRGVWQIRLWKDEGTNGLQVNVFSYRRARK